MAAACVKFTISRPLLALTLWILAGCTAQTLQTSTGNATVTITSPQASSSSSFSLSAELPPDSKLRFLRPTFTRTELKVARSLDPDNVQKLNVRSNNGRMVEIIVKKRDEKSSPHSRGSPQGSSKPVASDGYRVTSDNSPESVDLISAFLDHVNRIERPARQYEDESSIKNDRRPVRIAVNSRPVEENAAASVPAPVIISSDAIYMKDNPFGGKTKQKAPRALQEIDEDGIPVVHGIRVPDDEADKRQVWRNARVINGELVPYEKGHVPKRMEGTGDAYGQLIFARPTSSETGRHRSIGPFTTADNFARNDKPKSFGPFSVVDNLRSSVRVNEAEQPQPIIMRVPVNIGPFSRADNARVSNAKLIEYIKKINDQESRKHYYMARSPNKEIYAEQQPKIQRRMLQNPGNPVYPVSKLYSVPGSNKLQGELEDSRKPVLQYAHPELGVQPAKFVPPEHKPTPKATKKIINVEFAKHNDHSPFAIEPAMMGKDYYDNPLPVKFPTKHPYDELYQPSKMPATYPYTYGFIRRVKPERPLWMTLTEKVKDSFQNGIHTVHEFTKPVLDPLVEAGHKISKNLGFAPKPSEAKDKADLVVAPASSSIVLPALGVLAGGAALSLGAVAMGRFFDLDMLRRSGEQLVMELDDLQHRRALEGVETNPEKYYLFVPTTAITQMEQSQSGRRSKRSIVQQQQQQHDSTDSLFENEIYRNDKFDDQGDVIEIINVRTADPSDDEELPDDKMQRLDATFNGHSRYRRAIGGAEFSDGEGLSQVLQDVERDLPRPSRVAFEQQLKQTDWKNPSCAKRTFCLVMVQQGADDVVLMEKKMYTMLEMMHPTLGATLTNHLSEVTDAIRQHNCGQFVCQQRPKT
ncbi:uncharacterized protein LOC129729742 [Wyeomyia smithii]|uniref:uncharacterized protein LOC129729742 n=1 Tax=Wyeomyia smithii TaxID=174621 RepID=UPI002467B9D8|nr:uncharacterized protein LOC129729742 [Wyeomyia smithii]XP_055544519.1 uncharacterized protein LOC129729742 [Wyeomyia smithii]XP_055544520.1 uncharacterized protein LOC129729742 [Wyeomyia smithii]XP_055544521.1 uncharacterized protein LOC129729742 [Wyeomyia smithii]XP_055544522.1 uncharacterized protein LOC129729742 [Wyeomyia smithii]XP_055544523.1 uncharacterized protein LOC129729742 [Wyeomyia smithii]XP_055544525.1 uncharacterized protein LOC129729742 [Wyeomyia smithii]XP_055544526.1 unc